METLIGGFEGVLTPVKTAVKPDYRIPLDDDSIITEKKDEPASQPKTDSPP